MCCRSRSPTQIWCAGRRRQVTRTVDQQTSWCAVPCNYITSARTYQYYDENGWYSITGTFGPQWSTGVGPGVYSDTVHGYIFWHWSIPGVPLSGNNGTSHLDTTVDAAAGSHT